MGHLPGPQGGKEGKEGSSVILEVQMNCQDPRGGRKGSMGSLPKVSGYRKETELPRVPGERGAGSR